jgi:16S rRNA (cytosine967-C5)-methyltransferase
MRVYSHLNTAGSIIRSYDGSMPLSAWLKNYFRQEKKFGSRDRRQIAHLLYCYYRMGGLAAGLPVEETLLTALFLCSQEGEETLATLRPDLEARLADPLPVKLEHLRLLEKLPLLFPLPSFISPEIDKEAFLLSHFLQPLLFLRTRPGAGDAVCKKLEEASIAFTRETADCLALPNGTKVEEVIRLNREAVVQDISSQRVLEGLPPFEGSFMAWDCCAASGGKSILLHDRFASISLTVSDIRKTILVNLERRFAEAGIRRYQSFVADLSAGPVRRGTTYALVVCDAPCSGSGTWGRTPEQLRFFTPQRLDHYSRLQQRIALHASRSVGQGGYFLYITCSVYRQENEEVVAELVKESGLQLLGHRYFHGYHQRGDTLYAAVLTRS